MKPILLIVPFIWILEIATQACPPQKSVRFEIIDFLAIACHVFIHDEDANDTDLEYTFWIRKDDRSGSGKPCAAPAGGHGTRCQSIY